MDDRRRQQLSSKIEIMENLITEKVTKSIRESLGVGLRSFLQPLEQASSDKSTCAADKKESRKNNNKRKNVKEEPITPRSCKNSPFLKRSNHEQQDENTADRSSCKTINSPSNSKQSSVIWKGPNLSGENPFKIKCNLRISFSNDSKTPTSSSRRVYLLDCDDDCERFAETPENPRGKFENCYELRMELSDDDYPDKCLFRVSIDNTSYDSNRRVYVTQCAGDCGEFCESHIPNELFENDDDYGTEYDGYYY